MRTIEEDVCKAIVKGENFSKQNTVVNTNYERTKVYLHGNLIFELDRTTNEFKWDDCGWPTKTTQSRLNACLEAHRRLGYRKHLYSYTYAGGAGKLVELTKII